MLEQQIATSGDMGFIASCLLYGARKGHYSFNASNDQLVRFMQQEVRSIITQQNLLDKRHAHALIYRVKSKRVALLIVADAGLPSGGIEIYALSVAQKFQGLGYARQVLESALGHYIQQDVYARCAPASYKMLALLLKLGFEKQACDGEYQLLFRGGLSSADLPVSSCINY